MQNMDSSTIDGIILNEFGQKKILDKIVYDIEKMDSIFGKISNERKELIDFYKNEANKLNLKYFLRTNNGYEFSPHEFLPGLIAVHVGRSENDLFENNDRMKKMFIPWTDIYDLELSFESDYT